MRDGLYIVSTSYFVAGFVIRDGKLAECAPILRGKIKYWMTKAKYLGP